MTNLRPYLVGMLLAIRCAVGVGDLAVAVPPDDPEHVAPSLALPPQGPARGTLVPDSTLPIPGAESIPSGLPTLLGRQAAPIDLDSAMRLAGVANPEIQIAAARVNEALAERQ